ncbi:DUF3460 family protein [Paraburkholderia strydomiana]|jgi:hypothetical protein|uniref:DUF3460 family protein n=1 Tax=Paraburkholderia strydomiana TaxID=1245417 RepID=UPI0038B87D95
MKFLNRSPNVPSATNAGLYVFPFEHFLNQCKSTHPEVDREHMQRRVLLWDKLPIDSQTTDERSGKGRLTQSGYVY